MQQVIKKGSVSAGSLPDDNVRTSNNRNTIECHLLNFKNEQCRNTDIQATKRVEISS